MFEALDLARLQFALTSIYHWLFVPFTLGMTVIVAILEWTFVSTGKEVYQKMAKFWGKLFLINFAMGVVTGIVQEFHFGMNWAEYSRFMGDIFGAPLALEALMAFFLESTFMGVWIFGWGRLSNKAHATVATLVALGTNLSAFWILVANSFMQHPVGYVIRNGRAEMENFATIVSNGYVPGQFAHIVLNGSMTAGVIIMAISAWHLIRKSNVDFYKTSVKWGMVITLIAGTLGAFAGHPLGNIIIAGLSEMQGSTYNAMQLLSLFFHTTGKIYPSSDQPLTLHAVFKDGSEVAGESHIADHPGMIDHVYVTNTLDDETPQASRRVVNTIIERDMIVLGPGSL